MKSLWLTEIIGFIQLLIFGLKIPWGLSPWEFDSPPRHHKNKQVRAVKQLTAFLFFEYFFLISPR